MAPCGECHRAGGLAGLGGSVCPRVRPAPTAQQCTQRQEFSLGGGHPGPLRPLSCTPCPPCTPTLHARVDGQLCVGRRSTVGGGSWCWSRALTRTLRVPLAGVGGGCCYGGRNTGPSSEVSLLASSRWTLSRCACPRSRQTRGAARRSRRTKLDCGHLNKTEDEGR